MKALLFSQGARDSDFGIGGFIPNRYLPPSAPLHPAVVVNGNHLRNGASFDQRAEAAGIRSRDGPLARLFRGESLGWGGHGNGHDEVQRSIISSISLLGVLGGQIMEIY